MENINKLIALLMAIQCFCKDVHYSAKGEAAFAKHLLADRIQENLSEYIDSLKEVFFLGMDKKPLSSKEYLNLAAALIPEIKESDKENFEVIAALLLATMRHIETLSDLTKGEENLIGNIAENIQNSLGLVNLQIKG